MVKAILFDFDGTLVDSVGSIWAEYQRVAGLMDLPERSYGLFRSEVGKTWDDALNSLWPGVDVEEFSRLYWQKNEVIHPIDGVNDALSRLTGYRLLILTSRGRRTLELHLDGCGIDKKLFEAIYSRDDLAKHKPDPIAILQVLDQQNIRIEDAVYVGDSLIDAECAKAAGVAFIGVLTGGALRDDFKGLGVESILDSVACLPDYLMDDGH